MHIQRDYDLLKQTNAFSYKYTVWWLIVSSLGLIQFLDSSDDLAHSFWRLHNTRFVRKDGKYLCRQSTLGHYTHTHKHTRSTLLSLPTKIIMQKSPSLTVVVYKQHSSNTAIAFYFDLNPIAPTRCVFIYNDTSETASANHPIVSFAIQNQCRALIYTISSLRA